MDERSVEFEGRLRVVVARAGGGALAIREALAGEEISRVGPARNVHYSILVLREQVKLPSGTLGDQISYDIIKTV